MAAKKPFTLDDLKTALRAFAVDNCPGETATGVTIRFVSGNKFAAPISAVAPPETSGRPTASADFRSVNWFGNDYTFTALQAKVVSLLWDGWVDGVPDMGEATILTEAESESKKLLDVFRSGDKRHPAWGTMIQSKTKGTYRLQEP